MHVALSILVTAAVSMAPPDVASTQPGSSEPPIAAVTSRPTSQADDPLIAKLISDLGAPDFRRRNAAQARLVELRATALPMLIRHINDPSPEISSRVQAIVQPPQDPELRVELAVALLATRNPEPMEQAVYMMFDMPEACCELFLARVPGMQKQDRVVGEAIAEQFRTWRGQFAVFQRNFEKTRKRDADSAARILKMQTDGNVVHAEAAYQSALEALESNDVNISAQGTKQPAVTQPSKVNEGPPAAP